MGNVFHILRKRVIQEQHFGRQTYSGVNGEENYDGRISSPICVGQEGPDERREEASADPGRHVPCGVDIALMEHGGEVGYQVPRDREEAQAFAELSAWNMLLLTLVGQIDMEYEVNNF